MTLCPFIFDNWLYRWVGVSSPLSAYQLLDFISPFLSENYVPSHAKRFLMAIKYWFSHPIISLSASKFYFSIYIREIYPILCQKIFNDNQVLARLYWSPCASVDCWLLIYIFHNLNQTWAQTLKMLVMESGNQCLDRCIPIWLTINDLGKFLTQFMLHLGFPCWVWCHRNLLA